MGTHTRTGVSALTQGTPMESTVIIHIRDIRMVDTTTNRIRILMELLP